MTARCPSASAHSLYRGEARALRVARGMRGHDAPCMRGGVGECRVNSGLCRSTGLSARCCLPVCMVIKDSSFLSECLVIKTILHSHREFEQYRKAQF